MVSAVLADRGPGRRAAVRRRGERNRGGASRRLVGGRAVPGRAAPQQGGGSPGADSSARRPRRLEELGAVVGDARVSDGPGLCPRRRLPRRPHGALATEAPFCSAAAAALLA